MSLQAISKRLPLPHATFQSCRVLSCDHERIWLSSGPNSAPTTDPSCFITGPIGMVVAPSHIHQSVCEVKGDRSPSLPGLTRLSKPGSATVIFQQRRLPRVIFT